MQAAIIAAVVANTARDQKARPQPFTATDFMPSWDRPEPEAKSWEDQLSFIEVINAALGGDDLRKR
jgi:hypothetical protein